MPDFSPQNELSGSAPYNPSDRVEVPAASLDGVPNDAHSNVDPARPFPGASEVMGYGDEQGTNTGFEPVAIQPVGQPGEVDETNLGSAHEYVNPVDNFNAINERTAQREPWTDPGVRPLEGDPVTVAEIRTAVEAAGGQITFGEYMDIALYGEAGYYSTGKVAFQGGGDSSYGDFHTSPEASEEFSRVMASGVRAVADTLGDEPFNLVELGAGTGRMTKDVLATLRNEDPATYDRVSYYVADYGGMTERQMKVVGSDLRAHDGSYAARSTPEEHQQDLAKVLWVPGSALELELDNNRPTVVISNEVPDALRTEVVRNQEGVLEQKYVALDGDQPVEQWGPLTEEVSAYMDKFGTVIEPGKEAAISPAVIALQQRVGQMLLNSGKGAWINVDYSSDGPRQYEHSPWTPGPISMFAGHPIGDEPHRSAVRTYPPRFNALQMTGDLDLTHDPDFAALRATSVEQGLGVAFDGTQGEFVTLFGLPDLNDMEAIREIPGISDASKRRIDNAQGIRGGSLSSFRVLVVTAGIEPDFETQRPPLPGYREFYE